MKALVQEFWQEEDGLQTIELVLILVVLVGLVFTLQTAASGWLTSITGRIKTIIDTVDTNSGV